jgi:hypothetical protein
MCIAGCTPRENQGEAAKSKPGTPANCTSASCPAEKVKGTPVAIPAGDNSIVCRGGRLVVQNNNSGSDRACTQAHEEQHMKDWKERYGEDLCSGVSDGQLPVGGDGYTEFLRQSECKAYKVGKTCRENSLKTATDADKPGIQKGIDRDNAQLNANSCN